MDTALASFPTFQQCFWDEILIVRYNFVIYIPSNVNTCNNSYCTFYSKFYQHFEKIQTVSSLTIKGIFEILINAKNVKTPNWSCIRKLQINTGRLNISYAVNIKSKMINQRIWGDKIAEMPNLIIFQFFFQLNILANVIIQVYKWIISNYYYKT